MMQTQPHRQSQTLSRTTNSSSITKVQQSLTKMEQLLKRIAENAQCFDKLKKTLPLIDKTRAAETSNRKIIKQIKQLQTTIDKVISESKEAMSPADAIAMIVSKCNANISQQTNTTKCNIELLELTRIDTETAMQSRLTQQVTALQAQIAIILANNKASLQKFITEQREQVLHTKSLYEPNHNFIRTLFEQSKAKEELRPLLKYQIEDLDIKMAEIRCLFYSEQHQQRQKLIKGNTVQSPTANNQPSPPQIDGLQSQRRRRVLQQQYLDYLLNADNHIQKEYYFLQQQLERIQATLVQQSEGIDNVCQVYLHCLARKDNLLSFIKTARNYVEKLMDRSVISITDKSSIHNRIVTLDKQWINIENSLQSYFA